MQGIAVPSESVRPAEFFARTRRRTFNEGNQTWGGFGGQNTWELKKSDIIAVAVIRFTGSLVVTPGTGSVASTARWPYDMLKAVRFTANGASNVINASGLKLKVREYQKRGDANDRGVTQTIGGVSVNQGTLSQSSESWGVGSNTSALTGGTFPVDLYWVVPIAEDEVDLSGAIFAATSSTDLTIQVDSETAANLFALTGNATVALTGNMQTTTIKYSIPIGSDGQIVVPDLSLFHSYIQSRTTQLGTGGNEVRLIGQGAGKTLLRTSFQTWNGSPSAPLPMTDTNYGEIAWRYGSNETPDDYLSGSVLRQINERTYNTDIGKVWGFGTVDFAAENAFRDAVDMGTTSDLRLLATLQSGVTLNAAAFEYVQETIFQAGAGS
ncbi:hypothetical protein OG762_52460 (plasmid) [Streptomyces sp. NBC_01136]|uniref:hypothetical protein n=1 Tax=Streptomyces sp. NBC_01136 TaxID=2903754 RepID=UPI00386B3FAA|nr:hypothetical protein OG762_52460 [Streptomyces sp. NBC_01136]